MRSELIGVVGRRSAHFASNLGVVELCLALHLTLRLHPGPPDLGHRPPDLSPQADHRPGRPAAHDPDQGGPDGLPQPGREPVRPVHDRPRRLLPVDGPGAQGRRRARPATRPALRRRHRRRRVALGHRLRGVQPRQRPEEEAAGHPERQQDVDLPAGRRRWPITSTAPGCPAPTTTGTSGSNRSCPTSPWSATTPSAGSSSSRTRSRPRSTTGCSSRSWGFVYLGPIDGHDLKTLRSYLERVKAMDGPVLLHILTNKGHGFEPADERPGQVPRPGAVSEDGQRGRPAQDLVEPGLHRRRQRHALRGLPPRPQGRRDHRRDVRGKQAPEDPRDLPRPVLRRRHLREPRRRLRRRHGQGRRPAGRRHLQHVPPALVRPDLPGSRAPEPAGRLLPRPRRPGRRRRARRTTARTTWLTCASSPTWSSWPPATRKTSPRCSTSPCDTTRRSRSATRGPTSRRSSARSSPSSWARPRSSSGRPTACSWPAARWSAAACGRPSGCASGTACGSA